MPIPILVGALAFLGGSLAHLFTSSGPVGEQLDSTWRAIVPNTRTPEDVCIALRLFNIIDNGEYNARMVHFGYPAGKAQEILTMAKSRLPADAVVTLGFRHKETADAIATKLRERGWVDEEAADYVEVMRPFPSAQDVVTWAAREAFSPDMIAKFGLAERMPSEYLDWAQRVGWDEEVAKRYWYSHWRYPGTLDVFEMRHRGVIGDSDVDAYFQQADMAPFWREGLLKIAYVPFTRVDIRRMHKIGLIKDEELSKYYQDIGYYGDKAEMLAQFTIKLNAGEAAEETEVLSKAMLSRAFKLGMIDDAEYRQRLIDLKVPEAKADFYVQVDNMTMAMDEAADWVSLLRSQVKSGIITAQEAATKMASLGLSDRMVRHFTDLFESAVGETTRLPSKTDIKGWVQAKLISLDEAYTKLVQLGYAPSEIANYLELWSTADERYKAWIEKMRQYWGK